MSGSIKEKNTQDYKILGEQTGNNDPTLNLIVSVMMAAVVPHYILGHGNRLCTHDSQSHVLS